MHRPVTHRRKRPPRDLPERDRSAGRGHAYRRRFAARRAAQERQVGERSYARECAPDPHRTARTRGRPVEGDDGSPASLPSAWEAGETLGRNWAPLGSGVEQIPTSQRRARLECALQEVQQCGSRVLGGSYVVVLQDREGAVRLRAPLGGGRAEWLLGESGGLGRGVGVVRGVRVVLVSGPEAEADDLCEYASALTGSVVCAGTR